MDNGTTVTLQIDFSDLPGLAETCTMEEHTRVIFFKYKENSQI